MDNAAECAHRSPNKTGFADLVIRIQNCSEAAEEELYQILNRGVRYFLARHLCPADVEDALHDVYLVVVTAIRNRILNHPAGLVGYIQTVARRKTTATFVNRKQVMRGPESSLIASNDNPELDLLRSERVEIATQALGEVSPRDREILTRFYTYEQTREQICADMKLSLNQFRLLKSRAKARFGERGRRRFGTK
jgi:RNA polymerase sigma factor (sigma-70 family)